MQTIRFASQVSSILHAIKNNPDLNPVVLSDLNLNYKLIYNTQYQFRNLIKTLHETIIKYNLIQLANFTTWSRVINRVLKESVLDHVYTRYVMNVLNLYSVLPDIEDHRLIVTDLNGSPTIPLKQVKRN